MASRRALIPADELPRDLGSSAWYSCQTILLLWIADIRCEYFRLELKIYRGIIEGLRSDQQKASFVTMWGKGVAIYAPDGWRLCDLKADLDIAQDVLFIRLDPHLEVIAAGFGVPYPLPAPR